VIAAMSGPRRTIQRCALYWLGMGIGGGIS